MSDFTAEHELFRKQVRRFVQTEIDPHVEAWEAARGFPKALFRRLGELGMLGPAYPEEYGGGGADFWFHAVLAEELGRAGCMGVPMAILVQTDMALPALAEFGSHELKRDFLAPALAGEKVAAIAVTEPGVGSDVAALATRAESDGDHYVIHGSKMWITNGCQADFVVTLCRTTPGSGARGMSLLVVPTDTPGFHVGRKLEKLGNHSSDTGLLTYEGVRVPRSHCIGPEGRGFALQMKQFQRERLVGALMAVGGARKMVEMTAEYCRTRQAFGRPLLHNQWIQFRLAELATEIEALRHLAYHCARQTAAGQEAPREASMAKLKAGRLIREVADTCLQFHGAMGYAEEYPMARLYRDARLLSIGGGADEIMLTLLARLEGWDPGRP